MLGHLNARIFERPIIWRFEFSNGRSFESFHFRALECLKNRAFSLLWGWAGCIAADLFVRLLEWQSLLSSRRQCTLVDGARWVEKLVVSRVSGLSAWPSSFHRVHKRPGDCRLRITYNILCWRPKGIPADVMKYWSWSTAKGPWIDNIMVQEK